ncbi:MAG: hypothetical protein KDD77_11150, partial [Caldilineaceae bacterium]|nr:hypothetical protein [Caldilineaceae bacterium]
MTRQSTGLRYAAQGREKESNADDADCADEHGFSSIRVHLCTFVSKAFIERGRRGLSGLVRIKRRSAFIRLIRVIRVL